jgi:sterol 3beta-glucosyltransferase
MKIGLQTWGSEGDVRPFIALAAGLAAAGHQVRLAASHMTGQSDHRLAGSLGFDWIEVPGPPMSAQSRAALFDRILAAPHPARQLDLLWRHGIEPMIDTMFDAAAGLARDSDVLVGHPLVFPLRAAADLADRPIATVHLAHAMQPSADICPPGWPSLGRTGNRIGWRLARSMLNAMLLPSVNAFRRRHGLRPDSDLLEQTWTSGLLNLIAVSPGLFKSSVPSDPRHAVCGFLDLPDPGGSASAMPPLPEAIATFLDQGPAPVYFGFGSMIPDDPQQVTTVGRIWADAVNRVGCRAIFQLPLPELASRFETPGRIMVTTGAPHGLVFPYCSAIVHHGGAGTSRAALRSGRPSVVVAHLLDQFFWANELERVGVAPRPLHRRSLTAPKLARALASALQSASMASQAARIGAALDREDGVSTAVGLIETRLGALLQPG